MKKLLIIPFLAICIFANDVNLLTNTKQEIIQLKKEQADEKEQVNKYNWISDININSTISKDQDDIQSEDYSISISQDIFKFGGINSQIDYSKELKKLDLLTIDINTKEDIGSLYSYLIDIKLNEIALKQNILHIKNSTIELDQKKSEYKAGELGISDLNNVIMTKNALRETQKSLLLEKGENLNSLKEYTKKEYSLIKIPKMKLMTKELFLQSSTAVKYASLNSNVNKYSYEVKKSDYLPKLTLNTKYGYNNSDTTNVDDYYTYGLNISIPISFTSSNDIQQSKLEYLISKKELADKKNSANLTYDKTILIIQNLKEKIKLAQEDIKLYDELLSINEEEYKAGYKTLDDVETLKNSKQIRELDIASYEFNIQMNLISLYSLLL